MFRSRTARTSQIGHTPDPASLTAFFPHALTEPASNPVLISLSLQSEVAVAWGLQKPFWTLPSRGILKNSQYGVVKIKRWQGLETNNENCVLSSAVPSWSLGKTCNPASRPPPHPYGRGAHLLTSCRILTAAESVTWGEHTCIVDICICFLR